MLFLCYIYELVSYLCFPDILETEYMRSHLLIGAASSGSGMIAIFFLVSSFDVCTQRPASPFSKVVKVKAKRCKVVHNASFLGHYLWQKYNYISREQTFRQIFLRFCPKTPLRHASCGPSRRSLAAARQETVERFPQVGA